MIERKILLSGEEVAGEGGTREIASPYDRSLQARVHQASWAQAERALHAAVAARHELARQTAGRRRAVCQGIADRLQARAAELARVIALEAGKPIAAARAEVARAATTFALAAGEVAYFGGEILPGDLDEAAAGYRVLARRVPDGPVVGISPFNFPLNLAAHKVAPALAVGAPIVLKPPPQAPSAALLLGQIAREAGAAPAALSVLPCENAVAERLATDDRVRVLSFTGSARVGWELKRKAARARTLLELGGNAGVLVAEDADLPWAVERCATGAFVYAGQVCISVQRIFVQRQVHQRFLDGLVARAEALQPGDPLEERTVVGPLIDEAAAVRVESWLEEARAGGARVLCGGRRRGALLEPAVIVDAPRSAKIVCEEAFGPVVVVEPYDAFEAALAALDEGPYGLQAGLFTYDLRRVRAAADALTVGGLVVNDAPTFRVDSMPYGGRKASGLGREGIRCAMAEMSDYQVVVLGAH
ncbi:MAG TPA: aldehyde dehydrogenase family protein [Myxococcales bacterium]|nr:aldehyde dehydrogenase family protein [Myxococcales bacterium]